MSQNHGWSHSKENAEQHLRYQNQCITVTLPILNGWWLNMQKKPSTVSQKGNGLYKAGGGEYCY